MPCTLPSAHPRLSRKTRHFRAGAGAPDSSIVSSNASVRWSVPGDWATIEASVKKTNAVLIVEQGAQGTSYGAWLADEIQRRYFDWLDQPVQRVTGQESSPSISRVLSAS